MNATSMPLEKVIDLVHDKSKDCWDENVPVESMAFDSLESLSIDGESYEVLPSAQKLLANRLRIPYSYLLRCPSYLVAENLNYWLEQEAKSRDSFFCRFDGKLLRACFTDRYRPLDNMEILTAMLQHSFSPAQQVKFAMSENMMVVNIPTWNNAFEVLGRDKMVPGISFSNSEVGMLAFSIELFFWRLVCSNGLIAPVSAGNSKFKHISRRAIDNFPEAVSQVIAEAHVRQEQLTVSTQTPVHEPLATIEAFNRKFAVTKEEAELVARSWEKEPGDTMFSIINAYTRTAREPGLSVQDAHRFERIGGQLLSMVRN